MDGLSGELHCNIVFGYFWIVHRDDFSSFILGMVYIDGRANGLCDAIVSEELCDSSGGFADLFLSLESFEERFSNFRNHVFVKC